MRRFLTLFVMLMFSAILAFAQNRVVTGTVTDDLGNPVPFATVTVKGTNTGTSADANGRYSIRARQGDVLVVSATGLQPKEFTVGTQDVMALSVSRGTADLQEVVVTSAFNIKRTARSVSSNAQVVGAEQLNVIRPTNLNNALAGKVSGIQVRSQSAAALGRTGGIRLRGESGLNTGSGGPLYVVDGNIIGSPDDVNIDDIEDVTVLQGPAAAALFGSRGANGAIVMTLKKGRRSASGIGVDVNLGVQFDRVSILPNYQNSYAGGANADLTRYTWQAGHPVEWKALDGKYYHDYSDDASWGPRMVGQEYIPWYSWYGGHSRSFTTASLVPQPDNARDFFNTGVTLNNSIAFSKVTDGSNFRFSYGNVDVKGLLPTTGLKKHTINLLGSVDLGSRFTLGTNINYVTQKVEGEIDDAYSNQSTGSFNQWFHRNVDMNIMKELKDLRTPDGIWASWNKANPNSYDPTAPNKFYAGNYWYNFYKWFDLAKNYSNSDKIFGDVSLAYKIMPGLQIKGTLRKRMAFGWGERQYSSDLLASGLQTQGNAPEAFGYYETNTTNSNRHSLELLVSFSRKIMEDFQLNLNTGANFSKYKYKDNRGNTNQGLVVPNLFTLANSKNPATQANYREEDKNRAVFVRGDLGFRNFLFGEFTLRNDWYSTLPAENNDILSKSFGASFVFSDLVKTSAKWLSYGKLRASWGEIPQAIGIYAYPGFVYGLNQFQWNGNALMSTPDQLVDSAIRGAVQTQKEIGLEVRFLKNRLGLTATYWDGTERDIPNEVTINGASGFTRLLINTGEISKKGIELQFMAKPLQLANFKWELNATYAKLLENKVVKIAPGLDRFAVPGQQIWRSGAPYIVHQEGKDWGQIFGNGIKRIDGKPVLTSTGSYESDPNVFFGSALPEFTGGLQNSFQFLKNFTLNANIDYQKGGKFFSLSDMWGSYSGLTARTATINDKGNPIRDAVADGGGVHVFGVDATGRAVDYYVEAQSYFHNLYGNQTYDEFVYDLTFVKLRELSLGYNIPVNKIGLSKWISRANFSIVSRNPLLIYAQTKDLDPSEVSYIGGEAGQFPGTRGIGFNLKLGF